MFDFWFTLNVYDMETDKTFMDNIIIQAEQEDRAWDDLNGWLDYQYPEDRFQVDIIPEFEDGE